MVSGGQGITVSPRQGAGQAGGKQRQPQPWASGASIGTGQAGASPGHGPAGVLIRSSEKNGGQTWPWNHWAELWRWAETRSGCQHVGGD